MQPASDEDEHDAPVEAPSAYNKPAAATKEEAGKKQKATAGNRLAQLKEKRRGKKTLQPVRKKLKKDGKGGKGKRKGKK